MPNVTVTMLQTRLGEDGTQWAAGSAHTATEEFARLLITANLAAGELPNHAEASAPSLVVNAYDGQGSITEFVAGGVVHTVAYPTATTVSITPAGGDAHLVTLNTAGRVVDL